VKGTKRPARATIAADEVSPDPQVTGYSVALDVDASAEAI
jgi:hypothetical protein